IQLPRAWACCSPECGDYTGARQGGQENKRLWLVMFRKWQAWLTASDWEKDLSFKHNAFIRAFIWTQPSSSVVTDQAHSCRGNRRMPETHLHQSRPFACE